MDVNFKELAIQLRTMVVFRRLAEGEAEAPADEGRQHGDIDHLEEAAAIADDAAHAHHRVAVQDLHGFL